jgi:hypothetical protein
MATLAAFDVLKLISKIKRRLFFDIVDHSFMDWVLLV